MEIEKKKKGSYIKNWDNFFEQGVNILLDEPIKVE